MDYRLELISIPVSDVDRAKAFYVDQAGFNADHDHRCRTRCASCSSRRPAPRARSRSAPGPARSGRPAPRRACSSWSTTSRPRTPISPGAASRSATSRTSRGASFVFFSDPDGNGWAVQQIPPRALDQRHLQPRRAQPLDLRGVGVGVGEQLVDLLEPGDEGERDAPELRAVGDDDGAAGARDQRAVGGGLDLVLRRQPARGVDPVDADEREVDVDALQRARRRAGRRARRTRCARRRR